MIDGGSSEPTGDFLVEPEQLDRQAMRFEELGDTLRRRVGEAPRPAQLGTAPPARWFAQRLAALAGSDGATGMILSWADGLDGVGENQRAVAHRYRETDGSGAAAMGRTDTPGSAR
jgi:hypothetical protein